MNEKPKELKEHSAQIFEFGCMERPVYLKEDVDAVIVRLKCGLKKRRREMKSLLRFFRLPLMAIGIAIELMLIPIAWVVRFVEEHTDKEEK